MKAWLKGGVYGLFIGILISSIHFIINFDRRYPENSLSVFVLIFGLMWFIFYKIINAKSKNTKSPIWKIILALCGIGVFLNLVGFLRLSGESSPESVGMGIAYILRFDLVIFPSFIILLIILNYSYFYLEKITFVILILLVLVVISVILFNYYQTGWCRGGDFKCFTKRAIQEEDVSICDKAAVLRGSCKIDYAKAQDNESICEELDFGKYDKSVCYANFAIKFNNPSLCKKMYADWEKEGCCANTYDTWVKNLTIEQKLSCGIE